MLDSIIKIIYTKIVPSDPIIPCRDKISEVTITSRLDQKTIIATFIVPPALKHERKRIGIISIDSLEGIYFCFYKSFFIGIADTHPSSKCLTRKGYIFFFHSLIHAIPSLFMRTRNISRECDDLVLTWFARHDISREQHHFPTCINLECQMGIYNREQHWNNEFFITLDIFWISKIEHIESW